MTVPSDTGYVDYTQKGVIPTVGAADTTGSYTDTTSMARYPRVYSEQPYVSEPKLWGRNGYYMNGPYADPLNKSIGLYSQIVSLSQAWNEPQKRESLNNYFKLISQYGHTNSAGTLWALASNNLPADQGLGQQILYHDAKVVATENGESAPALAGSPSMTPEASWSEKIFAPAQFLSRNAFALLQYPLDLIQTTQRSIGGILANENLSGGEKFARTAFTGLTAPYAVVSSLGDDIFNDSEFVAPWEQTEYGQTAKALISGEGFDALTSAQAGLDVQRAKEELLLNPANKELVSTSEGLAQLEFMATEYAKKNNYYGRPGWFIEETSRVGEAARRAAFTAWAIPGPDDQLTAWTLGRGAASAVLGPDSSSFGVASGIVDFVAAIVQDPLSFLGLGPTAGLISKTTKTLSGGKVLFGKALEETVTKNAATYEAFTKIAQEMGYPIEEVGRFDFPQQAQLVHDFLVGNATDEVLAKLGIDDNYLKSLSQLTRRTYFNSQRAQKFYDKRIQYIAHDGLEEDALFLLDSYMNRTFEKGPDGKVVYNPDRYWGWYNEIIGERSTGIDAEKATLWRDLLKTYQIWRKDRDGNDLSTVQDFRNSLANQVSSRATTEFKTPKHVSSDRVQRDTARLYANENVDKEIEHLSRQPVIGTSTIHTPTPDAPVLSFVDGVPAITYLTGKAPLVFAEASDFVPDAARKIIVKKLRDAADNPDLRLSVAPDETVTLQGSINSQMHSILDLNPQFDRLSAVPSVLWGDLFKFAAETGLDGVLDDVLRSLPKKYRVDGIAGTSRMAGVGHWIGDHPRLLSYKIPKSAAEFGSSLRQLDSVDDAIAGMKIAKRSLVPVGLQGSSKRNVERFASSSRTRFANESGNLISYQSEKMADAVLQQQILDDSIRAIDDKFADPEQALRATVGYQLGMRNSRTGGITLDEKQVRLALFGNGPVSFLINRAFDALANFIPESRRASALKKLADGDSSEYDNLMADAAAQLFVITNGKWDLEAYRAVANNAIMGGGRDGLVDVIAPRLGVSIKAGSVSRTITPTAEDGKTFFRTWRTANPVISRALAAAPKTQSINLSNTHAAIDTSISYLNYAKVPPETISELIGKAIIAEGTVNATTANRNLIAAAFNIISKNLIDRIESATSKGPLFKGETGLKRKTEMINAVRESTRIWIGGMTRGSSEARARYATQSDIPTFTLDDATTVTLPGAFIETELATGFVTLPGIDEWAKMITRVGIATQRFPKGSSIYDNAMAIFDNYFRTAMLAFRLSYGIRNSAEMQVRIFMNGHHSLFSDPFTLAGMTVGNLAWSKKVRKYSEKRAMLGAELEASLGRKPTVEEVDAIAGEPPKQSMWSRLYTPYKDNAYGSDWEVGADEALAAANNAQDYMAITRMARSLNDYRVHNAAARQGWIPVSYDKDSPIFFKGWAHELFMLERSGIARLVLGTADNEPAVVVGTMTRYDSREAAVDWLMNNPEAAELRDLMIGSNPDFGKLFADKAATMDYLFSNPHSVYNRIVDYTAQSPQLKDFLRTGTLTYGLGERFTPRSMPDLKERWESLGAILQQHFNTPEMGEHFASRSVQVPWLDRIQKQEGNILVNWFFDVTNKFERLGSVGPEFRMAYWDKFAEYAQVLRREDIETALKSARTTLGPIKRMFADGQFDQIGTNHPAFANLKKAQESDIDGVLTLDDVHAIAAKYAAQETARLFYDAAKRNNFWNATRIIFPFGQAWGNTLATWSRLGTKNPLSIYKAQKAFNALLESGSSAVYDFGSDIGLYGQYAPGFAPWEQDSNGGFFYTDSYGDTSFMYPLVGRAAALPLNLINAVSGNGWAGIQEYALQSPASSLNLALGGENSIFPGVGPLAALPLSSGLLPDNELTASIRQIAAPFGEKSAIESAIPAWFAKMISGSGSLPVVGDIIGPFMDGLSPANKGKNVRDAMMILSSSGNYPNWATDAEMHRRLVDDSSRLAKAMLLTTGLLQNISPSTPYMQSTVSLSGDNFKGALEQNGTTALYTIGMLNSLFQQYRKRNAFDDSAAREEFVRDFGPGALFATTGDWVGMSRIPTSQALTFARANPQIARDNWDTFTLFFPQGDSSDIANVMWVKKNGFGDRLRKNPEEVYDEIIGYLQRVQLLRVQSMEGNGIITGDQAQAIRDDITERYLATGTTAGTFVNKTDEMERLNKFVMSYNEIQNTNAGQAFMEAWSARQYALDQARLQTGRERVTLGGNDVLNIKNWYISKITEINNRYPDFILLANKFRKEWD